MPQQFIGQSSSSLNNSIGTAVILAAGRGERIAGGEEYRSKPLIKLYDISLIERSIKKLSDKLNINKIYVITGFEHNKRKVMKKRNASTKKLKPNKINFRSGVSIYKEKFSDKEITFKPKFSITKNITFSNQKKIGNSLARAFERFKLLKF